MSEQSAQSVECRQFLLSDLGELQALQAEFLEEQNGILREFDAPMAQVLRELRLMRQNLILQERYFCRIAKVGDDFIGYIACVSEQRPSIFAVRSYATIIELYVRPEYRRRGVATQLFAELREDIVTAGIEHIRVQVPSGCEWLRHFYDKAGFVVQSSEMQLQTQDEE